ncbi:hypothetical protein GQ53DRAFT_761300 [Thozetella sp. PMI_491]|nr:hypothetical protein GQ53DRAFT_761300 [Thozetella sp. PMI_491]
MPFVSPLVSAFIGGGGYAFNIQKTLMIAREVHSDHIASIALAYSLGAKFGSIVGGSITKALMDIPCMGMGPALFYCFILRPQRLEPSTTPRTNAKGPAWNWIYDISRTFPHDTIRLWLGFIAAAPLQSAISGFSVQYVPIRFHGRTMSDMGFIFAICNFASIIFNLLFKYLVGKFRPQSHTNDNANQNANGRSSFHWYDDLSFVIFYLAVSLVASLILLLAPSLPVFIVGLVLGTVGGLFTTFSRKTINGKRGSSDPVSKSKRTTQYQGTTDELRPLLEQTDDYESDPSNIPQEIPDEVARMDGYAEAENMVNGRPEEETSSEPVEPEGEEQRLGKGGSGNEERGGRGL